MPDQISTIIIITANDDDDDDGISNRNTQFININVIDINK